MAKNFDREVRIDHFRAGARVHDVREGSLADGFTKFLQDNARKQVAKSNVVALTDNSGGAAGVVYAQSDSGVLSSNDLTGFTTGVTAASLNTAADTVMNAYAVLAERLNDAVFTPVGAGSLDEGPGTIAASGTVAVIDDTADMNTDDTDAASAVSARAVQRDLLHAQRTLMLAIDDARAMVGLARLFDQRVKGRWDGTGDLTFADANPDTITRASGSWVDDGFQEGDQITVEGSADNNGTFTIAGLTATVITLVAGDALTAEVITAATEGPSFELFTSKPVNFPGRLAGADPGPALGTTPNAAPAGADWTLEFETGTTAISDAVNHADPPIAAVLLAEWDAFVDQLSDNVALMADSIDAITGANATAAAFVTLGPIVFDETELPAGTDQAITVPPGLKGRIRRFFAMHTTALTVSDTILTMTVNGVTVVGASLTLDQASSAVGEVDEDAVADGSTTVVDEGDVINVVNDGGSTAGAALVWIEVEPTADGADPINLYAA